jgi:cytochrome P450 family 9
VSKHVEICTTNTLIINFLASTLLSFVAYELALNQEVQRKLFKEIEATKRELGGENLTYDALQKMEYLDMVVSEGLRKWPPAPVGDRFCVKDYKLKLDDKAEFTIEKGKYCWLPIYALHNDPKYWPNPEKFDPETI